MRRPFREYDTKNPDRILSHIINDYIEGRLGAQRVLFKVAVLKIDHVGGQLAGPNTPRPYEPPNPKNSIVGRIISDAMDRYTPEDSLTVFWPLFSHDVMPIKESEYAYVLFEDLDLHHGIWIARIPEPNKVNDLNITPGSKRYSEENEDLREGTGATEKAVQDTGKDPGVPSVSEEFGSESGKIPEYNNRVGDRVIQGSNNSVIVLSRDRIEGVQTGASKEAGNIDIVCGRKGEDINLKDDKSRILITMKSDVDKNFDIKGKPAGETAAIVAKSDEVRILARSGMKCVVESGPTSIFVDSKGNVNIKTSGNMDFDISGDANVNAKNIVLNAPTKVGSSAATEKLVKAGPLKELLRQICSETLAKAAVDVAGVPGVGQVNSNTKTAVDLLLATWEFTVESLSSKVE